MNDSKKKVLEIKKLATLQQIAEIKKLAQDAPPDFSPKGKPKGNPPPGGPPPGGPPPGTPPGGRFGPTPGTATPPVARPTGGGGGYHGSPAIKEMQKAIQDFATAAVKYRLGPPKPDAKNPRKMVRSIEDKDDRRNFNDFLAEQFSASADIHGDEFSTDTKDTAKDTKNPTDLIQLNSVIDGLQRIGPGNREAMADGVWDFRTNNAVRNVYALAAALVTANEALGGAAPNDPRVFRRGDLSKLKQAIPTQKDPMKEHVPQATLAQNAAAIAPLVEKLTSFYEYYSKSIMQHPAYKRYISDDVSLLTVKPGEDPAQPNAKETERLANSKQIVLPKLFAMNKENKPTDLSGRVTLDYLQSRKGLQKLMVDFLGYQQSEVNDGPAMRRVVKTLLDRINNIISNNKPIPVPPKTPTPQALPAVVDKKNAPQVA